MLQYVILFLRTNQTYKIRGMVNSGRKESLQMTSEEWKQQRFENWCREIRLQSQIKNNALKPKLDTEDVLETADFIFSPIRPFDRVGDSGNLLLAKRDRKSVV